MSLNSVHFTWISLYYDTLYSLFFHPSILLSLKPPVTHTGLNFPPFMIGPCPDHIVCVQYDKP